MEIHILDGKGLLCGAEESGTALVPELVRGPSEHEQFFDRVEATEELFGEFLFRDRAAEVIIAEWEGMPAGFALFFRNFSTFKGRPGSCIEDLFIKPEFRGPGKALFLRVREIAAQRNCGRLERACLDWNGPSTGFYRSQGGDPLDGWTVCRIGDPAGAAGREGGKEGHG